MDQITRGYPGHPYAALGAIHRPHHRDLYDVELISKVVCEAFSTSLARVRRNAHDRHRRYCETRYMLMFMLYYYCSKRLSKKEIGQYIPGPYRIGLDHSTVVHGIQTCFMLLSSDASYHDTMLKILDTLKARTETIGYHSSQSLLWLTNRSMNTSGRTCSPCYCTCVSPRCT